MMWNPPALCPRHRVDEQVPAGVRIFEGRLNAKSKVLVETPSFLVSAADQANELLHVELQEWVGEGQG